MKTHINYLLNVFPKMKADYYFCSNYDSLYIHFYGLHFSLGNFGMIQTNQH